MKTILGLIAVAMFATTAAAQDSTKKDPVKMAGSWDFSFTSPQGAANWRITFDQSGDTLRGSANTDFGVLDVSEGWVSGNDIGFTLYMNFQGTNIQVNFAGSVKGDTANGQIDVPNVGIQPFPFTAVKAASNGAKDSLFALRPERAKISARIKQVR